MTARSTWPCARSPPLPRGRRLAGRAGNEGIGLLGGAEVLRGPVSAQFSSDGLAGALSLTTLSPEDLLKGGKTTVGLLSATAPTARRLTQGCTFQTARRDEQNLASRVEYPVRFALNGAARH